MIYACTLAIYCPIWGDYTSGGQINPGAGGLIGPILFPLHLLLTCVVHITVHIARLFEEYDLIQQC